MWSSPRTGKTSWVLSCCTAPTRSSGLTVRGLMTSVRMVAVMTAPGGRRLLGRAVMPPIADPTQRNDNVGVRSYAICKPESIRAETDMGDERSSLDRLDVALMRMRREHPHAGYLELSRLTGVSRATLQARAQRLEAAGVITGYGPDVDLPAAGYPVLAFVQLQIAQGDLGAVTRDLEAIPEILEAHGTTGDSDVICRVAAGSHEELQQILLRISSSPSVVRSTSVVALSEIVGPRYLPLLESTQRRHPSRVTGLRSGPATE